MYLQGVYLFITANPASIFVATYAAHFWQCSQFTFDTQRWKRNISVAVLWCKLFTVRVLHVMWEDLHINTVEAVNEDGLRQLPEYFLVLREVAFAWVRREVSSWFHWYLLSHPLHWLANVNCFILQITEVWQGPLQDTTVPTDREEE